MTNDAPILTEAQVPSRPEQKDAATGLPAPSTHDTREQDPLGQSLDSSHDDRRFEASIDSSYERTRLEQAFERLLWHWKTPLAREWYPYLMGLRHDLALANDSLPRDRIHKTQTAPLAARLVENPVPDSTGR